MNPWLKKILFITFIIVIIFNSTQGFLKPKKAEAIVFSCVNCSTIIQQLLEYVSEVGTWVEQQWGNIQSAAQWVEEKVGRTTRDIIAKKIMDYIVDQTIKWVQGGGKPKFVTDWQGFVKDAGNIAFDQLIRDVGLARLCSPFSVQVKLSLLPVQRFPTQISCTLDQVIKNINNFYRDFSRGGWLAYNAMWNPENNYYGQMLMIEDRIQTETSKKVTAAINEAISGKGFLGVKKCLEPIYETKEVPTGGKVCELWNTTPGDPNYGECYSYRDDYVTEQVQVGCKKEEINTPGDVVGEAVKNAVGSDSTWAANIQSWTSALVNAVINRFISEGLKAMKGSSAGSGGGYYPPDYEDLVNQELIRQKQQTTADAQNFIKEYRYLINAKGKTIPVVQAQSALLADYQSRGCISVIGEISNTTTTAAALESASTTLSRLNGEIAGFETAIAELTSAIDRINRAATFTDLTREQVAFSVVYDKYNNDSFRRQLLTGSARQAADQETADAQATRDAFQSRLYQCLSSPLYVPPTPAPTSTEATTTPPF